jgi:hypothetical protein
MVFFMKFMAVNVAEWSNFASSSERKKERATPNEVMCGKMGTYTCNSGGFPHEATKRINFCRARTLRNIMAQWWAVWKELNFEGEAKTKAGDTKAKLIMFARSAHRNPIFHSPAPSRESNKVSLKTPTSTIIISSIIIYLLLPS